ncbi:hypothetical protein SPRG_10513 [Saprolegnia parasitica CBS 223.65]|uniref:E2F/DP family winged-helix DNA-binding domain-containing protein n=1 Tax=Saprolegnia parasitica (strain CBS 223.65) TaxID=695850 RepID=A0A067C3P7_SAPPC|nr:hypothetical protein SPRG_10513 [Saprolegnia parasitica CBS 223.65]KDO23735.1 hypothetical protein SPRG_10513 [Saprolegnia parasitica CBS 223.65]|eukprot:XP_012205553.1 hypothetical protein SPRG_10513 [Saprolegnia parasitica CBS 223.65]
MLLAPAKERSARNTNLQRMDKSITVLSIKFCAMLRNAPDAVNIVHAAKSLGTQKRRLHEILNIIQSVGLIAKVGIGLCRWIGDEAMLATLQRLKHPSPDEAPVARKAVATALSERFLQVFLHQERPEPVVLEDIMHVVTADIAACGDEHPVCRLPCLATPCRVLMARVAPTRRIYDIANVLCSLNLIKKILVIKPETRRKHITFIWCGPCPTHLPAAIDASPPAKRHRPDVYPRIRLLEPTDSDATTTADRSPPFSPPLVFPPTHHHRPLPMLEASPLYLILRNEQLGKELAEARARESELTARVARLEEQLLKSAHLRRPPTLRPLPFQTELDARGATSPTHTSLMAASTLLSFTPRDGHKDDKENVSARNRGFSREASTEPHFCSLPFPRFS